MPGHHRSALLSGLLVAATELSGAWPRVIAQTPPSTPTFPSGVDVITVDAVVVDGKGRPVPGLKREDFVVTEDGRPQEIVGFEAVQAAEIVMPAEPVEPAPIATNRAPTDPGREYAVLLDDIWIPPPDASPVREALTAFLTRSVRSGDQVTLANTTGDLRWTAHMPEGREDLQAVVARFGGRGPAQDVFVDADGSLKAMSESQAYSIVQGRGAGRRAIAMEIEARRQDRMRLTHAALHRELEALSNVRGRKSLLLVTRGFIQDSGPELRETTRIAHEKNVAIYFLDVRGLMTTPGLSADVAGSPDPSRVAASLIEQDVHDTAGSQDLAADTGGFSVRNANDFSAGMDRIATESRVFYMLGFQPAPGKAGEWRQLRVTVRRPGLTVRARRGYAWQPPPDRTATPSAFVPLRLASYVLDPVDADRTRVTVAIEVHVGGLAPSERDLTLRLEATPRDGSRGYRHEVAMPRDDAGLDNGGWQSTRLDFALPEDVYRIRAELVAPATQRRGVAEQRVAVPGRGLFRVSTPILSDTPTLGAGPSTPAPVARRSFSAGDGPLLYAFSILGAPRDPKTDRPDVTMRIAVKDGSGRALMEASDTAVTPSPDGRLEQVVSLPLAQMPPGEYQLQLTVRDRIAGQALESKAGFLVEGSAPAVEAADLDASTILGRAGRYVVAYQEVFRDLVAEEDYRQHWDSGKGQKSRRSRADMVFVSLPGAIPWAVFRDVYEVDGKKVRNREARLERLFRRPPDGAAAAVNRAKKILDESSRFNLGPVRRTVNIPTLALLVLHPDNQQRFAFERRGTKSIGGTEAVEVYFTEMSRPTFTRGRGGDLVARGSVWVDAEAGTVLRTEISYSPAVWGRSGGTSIVTNYEREARLQVTVPVQMTETYEWTGGAITAVARYSGYRRFEVTTDEEYTGPPEERR